jgi:hypothetical protein
MNFEFPPNPKNEQGQLRTVGFEIEFGGVDTRPAAEAVMQAFGGECVAQGPFRFDVEGTSLGDFSVKLDWRLGQGKKPPNGFLESLDTGVSQLAGSIASVVVPQEIMAPPIPLDRLSELERLLPLLRRAGASGTESSLLHAFGLHINPEVPSFEPRAITAVLKSFALLSPWLWESIKPDMTRRVLGFAKPFNANYVRLVARDDYWPDLDRLIDDYVDANPSRNHDLDPLPLFAYLDETRVRNRLPEEKINPRPTFHYRLPDARISDPGWCLASEWNRWVAVERLAADRARLRLAGEAYLRQGSEAKNWAHAASQFVTA